VYSVAVKIQCYIMPHHLERKHSTHHGTSQPDSNIYINESDAKLDVNTYTRSQPPQPLYPSDPFTLWQMLESDPLLDIVRLSASQRMAQDK
jgi:hypothetical protein